MKVEFELTGRPLGSSSTSCCKYFHHFHRPGYRFQYIWMDRPHILLSTPL